MVFRDLGIQHFGAVVGRRQASKCITDTERPFTIPQTRLVSTESELLKNHVCAWFDLRTAPTLTLIIDQTLCSDTALQSKDTALSSWQKR
jgi:hypothetical protein